MVLRDTQAGALPRCASMVKHIGNPIKRASALLVLACAVLVGCAPRIDTTPPSFPFAAGWQNSFPNQKQPIDAKQWWTGLKDPVLTALVEKALAESPDLTAAQLRAKAAWEETGAIQSLQTAEASAAARRSGGKQRSEDLAISSAINLQTVLDLGRAREAQALGAIARAGIAAGEESAARLLLIGEVSNSYLGLRAAQQQLELLRRAQQRQRAILRIAQDLLNEGEGTRIDTLRSQARLNALDTQRKDIEATIEREVLRLTLLTGSQPGALPPDLERRLRQREPQPRPRLAPDPVVPADLIRNRPDLLVAEARYNGARAALGSARAELYPSLVISGLIDARRITARNPLTDATETRRGSVVSLGPSLRLPELPTRATRASISAAAMRVEAEYQAWHAEVLKALFEVESSLLDYRKATEAEALSQRTVTLQSEAADLLLAALREGEATFGEMAAIQSDLIDLELTEVDKRLARARGFVDLHLRLGIGASR